MVEYLGAAGRNGSEVIVRWRSDGGMSFEGPWTVGDYTPADTRLSIRGDAGRPELALSNALRIWASVALPTERNGLMLHAASCVFEDCGIAIAGCSGAGKSTFANDLRGATYLTDDITLVDRLSTRPRLLATPFHGSLGRVGEDKEADLKVVGILRQSRDETRIHRLQPAEAVAALMRHVVAFSSEKRLAAQILDSVASLVARVPVLDIARSLSDSSDEVCRKLLDAAEASA